MKKWFNRLVSSNVNTKLADDLLKRTQSEVDSMEPVNILVAGKTGSGKSTLINALFREKMAETGVGKPVTQHIQRISKEGVPLVLYDTKGLELTLSAQREVLESLKDLIQTLSKKGPRESLDIVYYTLNTQMARIEPFEIDLIRALAKQLPVIVILTQALGEESREFEDYIKSLNLPVKAIKRTLAKPYLIQGEQYISAHGLQDIIDTTLEVVPKETHRAFINAQQIDLDLKVKSARRWANSYITTAFGVGFTPIPIADSALLVPMQIGMLAHITSIFGLGLDKAQIISIIAGIGGTGSVTLVGKYVVSSIFKVIPGLGTVAGGAISGTTAGVLTVTLAYSYIEVLRQIAQAELEGRQLPLAEIQKIMNTNFSEQIDRLGQVIPNDIKEQLLPKWFQDFLK